MYKILLGPALLLCLLTMFSCSSKKKQIRYFDDLSDTARTVSMSKINYAEPLIQVDDILNVTILTLDPNATQIINAGNLALAGSAPAGGGTSATQTSNGYLVNKEGLIDLPILGKIKVTGLSTSQAREMIEGKAKAYFKDPSVSIRITNFKITVAGEVAKPSTYIVPNEKVTLLDALGMAGDLTIYGKRENILLIRTNSDGSKEAHRLDMSKSNVLNSPYYYLKQNDYLYVEPSKTKIDAADVSQIRTITILGSLLSFFAIIITRVVK